MSHREWVGGTIREAVVGDAAAIARVHVATWQAVYRGHMPEDYLQALDPAKREVMWSKNIGQPGRAVFVASQGLRVVGFCSCLNQTRDDDSAEATAEITAIYVDPTLWRGGCGSALLRRALAHGRMHGLRQLTLWVLTANAGARAFYEAHGFVHDGRVKTERLSGFEIEEVRYRLTDTAHPRA